MVPMSMTKPSVSSKSWMVYTIHICFLLCIHQQLTKFFGYNIAITKTNWKTSCQHYGNGYNLSHFHISGSSVVHLPICNCYHKKATECKDWCFSDICFLQRPDSGSINVHLCNILDSINIGQIYSKQLLFPSFFPLIILSFLPLSFWLLPCRSAPTVALPSLPLGNFLKREAPITWKVERRNKHTKPCKTLLINTR